MTKKSIKYKSLIAVFVVLLLVVGGAIFIISSHELNPFVSNVKYFFIIMMIIFGISFLRLSYHFLKIQRSGMLIIDKLDTDTQKGGNLIEIVKCIFENSYFKEEFNCYQQSLDYIKDDIDENGMPKYKILSSTDAAEYINDDVIGIRTHLSIFNYIPHIFISTGIFGTFFGIVSGLGGLGEKINSESTEAIRLGIGLLLDSVQISFRSSLYGIVFSVVFALYYKCVSAEMASTSYNVALKINTIFPINSEILELHEIKSELQEQSVNLDKLARDMAEEVAKVLESSFTSMLDEQNATMNHMTESVSSSISNIGAESIENIVEPISVLINNVTEQYEKNSELLNTLGKYNMTFAKNVEVFEKLAERLVESVGLIREQLEMTIDKTVEKIIDSGDLADKSLEENKKTINELIESVSAYKETTTGYLDELDRAIIGIKDINTQASNNLESSKNYVRNIFEGQDRNLEILSSQKEAVSQLQEAVSQLQKDVHVNLTEYSLKVNEGLTNIFSKYDESAFKILGGTDNIVNEIADSMEKVVDISKRLELATINIQDMIEDEVAVSSQGVNDEES
jgi:hypothetical protein